MTRKVTSGWIASIAYRNGFLVIFKNDGEAMLYAKNPTEKNGGIPLLRYQLLCKYAKLKKSPGKAYNKLIKGQYDYQAVKDEFQVAQLKRMMK